MRGQFCESMYKVWSVRDLSSETSRACRLPLPSITSETPLSVTFEQLVNVKRSTRLQFANEITVPSFTSVKAERFNRLTRFEYEKSELGFPTEAATRFKLSQLLHDGRYHRIPTEFAVQLLHTSMQLNKSAGELSMEKMDITNSGGRRSIGGTYRPLSPLSS